MKKVKKLVVIIVALLLPATGLAFLGIGDSSDVLLGKMLAELIVHTETLRNVLTGVDYLNNVQNDIRQGIEDPILFERLGEYAVNDLMKTDEFREVPILGQMNSVGEIQNTVNTTWGSLPKSANQMKQLATKDLQAIYSISHAAVIKEEAGGFFQTGRTLLDDLVNAHESKAALRNAQASALQVQQLGQIEANQGLQISLNAQEILSENEKQKGIQQFNDAYLDMLQNQLTSLTPMGPR